MAGFLESLQQCNHWTFQSPWSHSWHVLKEDSSKMPLTCFIKQHIKLLHMQNPWQESKPWRLHSADEKLSEVEHFALSPLMSDIIITISAWCRPAMCCCTSVRAKREQASNSVTEVILMAPFVEQRWVTMIARGGAAWQTSRVSSANSAPLHLLRTSESNNYCFFLLLLIYLWNGLQLSPCCCVILAIILAISLSNHCCFLKRKRSLT